MREHLKLLGCKVRDVVTGFEGIVETVGFDLYGCIQAVVKPGLDDKGQIQDGRWLDVKRLIAISQPVMVAPRFDQLAAGAEIGASDKPAQFERCPAR